MKLIIFGSRGLVGSSLVKILNNNQLFTEIIPSTREQVDLFNLKEVEKFISDTNPDIIVNAAAKVGGIYANNTYRADFILQNLKINTNLLEAIIPFNKIKVINLGSSCIYPLNAENPISENSLMTGELEKTNSPYAMAKITAIELGKSINHQYGHKIINLMPTNLYGPNDNFSEFNSHVIPGIIFRMHKAKIDRESNFEIWGTGKPKREFMYVDDLADAILFIIKNNIEDELINIGSNEEVSINELLLNLKEIIEFEGSISNNLNFPDGNPKKLLNSAKILSYGWKPKTKLIEGLNKTYEWYLKSLTSSM